MPSKRTALFSLVVFIVAAALSAYVAVRPSPRYYIDFKSHVIKEESKPEFLPSVVSSPFQKVLLLTIDDGPRNPDIDKKILRILKKHKARSIWFVNCMHFDNRKEQAKQQNLEVLSQIVAEGHEIANHSYHHYNLQKLFESKPEEVALEINRCTSLIESTVGARPRYFRSPFGLYRPDPRTFFEQHGLQMVLWTGNTNDTNFKTQPEKFREYLFGHFITNLNDGDVILLHDLPHTADVLDEVLTELTKRGFKFVVPN